MLLAIDTATRSMSLALHDGETLIAEQTWRTGNRHNTLLAASVQQMLAVCDVSVSQLSAVAVASGPGSYTGLRIGIALAKGLAAVNNLPLIGVSTLDILAAGQPFHNTRYRLIAVMQAGRKRIIAGQYRVKKGRWEETSLSDSTTWDELLSSLDEHSYYVTGEVSEAGYEALESAKEAGHSLTLVNAAHRIRRAGFLAQEAWQRYHDGEAADFNPELLLPVYLKAPG